MSQSAVGFPTFPPIEPPQIMTDNRILPRQIDSGTMAGSTQVAVGTSKVLTDATNGRITVSDGTNIRVVIGTF